MRYLAAMVLLVPLVAAVPFSIDIADTHVQGGNISVEVVMNNTAPVYGYEFDVSSTATFKTYTFTNRVTNATNSFTIVNGSTVRAASVTGGGIPPGDGSVITLIYTTNQTGALLFSLDAEAYAQNGSPINTTSQSGQTTIEGNLLRVQDITTNQHTTNVTVCMQNADALTSMTIALAYENLTLTDSTSAYTQTDDGANLTFGAVSAHNDCETIATLTFAINASPGSMHAIGISAVESTPSLALGTENGTLTYNSYSLSCDALTGYRNTTQQIPLTLTNYTGLQKIGYNVVTALNFSGVESSVPTDANGVSHNLSSIPQPLAQLNITLTNESNGTYDVLLTNITAIGGELITHADLTCPLTIITHCIDADADNFTTGTECAVNTTLDCDDSRAAVNPNATETCNARDDNCNGQVDEGACPAGGAGGGGGGGSSGDSASSASGSTSGATSAFANLPQTEETSTVQPETPAPVQEPVKTELKPDIPPAPALEEPKEINLLAYIMGVLILLSASILTWYEWVKHKK